MKIIISPAKKMRDDIAYMQPESIPVYMKEAKSLLKGLRLLNMKQVQSMLKSSQAIAEASYANYQTLNLNKQGVPAILAYDGIQYTYMAPHIFTDEEFAYIQKHLFILSGLYGVLKPLDNVLPYRLELDNVFRCANFKSLYAFWGDKVYKVITKEDDVILDLASVQYAKIVKKYMQPKQLLVKCSFMEVSDSGLKEKGVYVKMARGAMLRYLAVNQIESLAGVKAFHELGYQFQETLSDETHFIFVREKRFTT